VLLNYFPAAASPSIILMVVIPAIVTAPRLRGTE
jgi:hypothetical protein